MKKSLALTVALCAAAFSSVHAQWNGPACDNRPVNVTVNRYNYYGTSGWAPGYGGWNGCAPWGWNGYGQPVPNGLGWTLYGFQAAAALFAPRPRPVVVVYPGYQGPAPVIIER
ncbi:MAG: hypothetical protein FGM15_09895 [Chthoniobacterales bacterium]|nr:hypothetical protein [Chthoniobacterales bacterium]